MQQDNTTRSVIDFTSFVCERTKDFTGRDWIFTAIDRWLADPEAPQYFILTGEPGIGKTAIAAQLAQIRDVAAMHFCIARQADTIMPLNFVRSLALQLAQINGFAQGVSQVSNVQLQAQQTVQENYGLAINVQINSLTINVPSATAAFTDLVIEPLKVLYSNGFDRQLVILVDALDEAVQQQGQETIVDLLANAQGLPSQVRFVLTSRPEAVALRHFEQLDLPHLRLEASGDENLHDVREYILRQLVMSEALWTRLVEQNMKLQLFIDRIATASEGNFLYLVWLLPAIAAGTQEFDTFDALPQGLDGIYREFLRTRKVGQDIDQWRRYYRPLLGVLAAAQAPLEAKQLMQFTEFDRQALDDFLLDVQQFLDPVLVQQERYQLYHQSVADFLANKQQAQEFWIDLVSIHERIANRYFRTYSDNWDACDDLYCLQNLVIHLARANDIQRVCQLIENQSWYAVRSKHDFSRRGYASDLDLAFVLAAEQGSISWPHLVANALLRATLTGVAKSLPIEIYEALVRLRRGPEALQRVRMIPEASQKVPVLKRIEGVFQELNEKDLAKQVQAELADLSLLENSYPEDVDSWVVSLVTQFGPERALYEVLRMGVNSEADRAGDVKKYIQVAQTAFKIGQSEAAHKMLLTCLEFVHETWEWERQNFLLQIANLLLQMGYESDIRRLIDLALTIELEPHRVFTLAELALICSYTAEENLKKYALESVIRQMEVIERKATPQVELSKIALVMSKIGDARAEKFLQHAIQLAEKPIQPTQRWEEEGAWINIVGALVSVGLGDEGLRLFKEFNSDQSLYADKVIVALALYERWLDAIQLVQDLRPIARKHALLRTANALMQQQKLTDDQYQIIMTQVENGLEQDNQPTDKVKTLEALVNLAVMREDRTRASRYLRQIINLLDRTPDKLVVESIVRAAHYAVKLVEVEAVHQLVALAQRLPEDSYHSHSTTMAALCQALAELGQVGLAWSLAQSITEADKRLEAQIRVCKSDYQRKETIVQYFHETLTFAQQIENVGFVPSLWGELAQLAHKLGEDIEECIKQAISGTLQVVPTHHSSFNIYNVANVARSLHAIGLSPQAQELLEQGFTYLEQTGVMIELLRPLAQAVTKIGASNLWSKVLQVAHGIKAPVAKAEALLGTTYAIAHSGDKVQAIANLPDVLTAIQNADTHDVIIMEFGQTLNELLSDDDETLNHLVAEALRHARVKDRPTVLTWLAALLPVFAKVDSALAATTWRKIEQVNVMLGQ